MLLFARKCTCIIQAMNMEQATACSCIGSAQCQWGVSAVSVGCQFSVSAVSVQCQCSVALATHVQYYDMSKPFPVRFLDAHRTED